MAKTTLIFDCDGVLINSEFINISVERKHLSHMGLDYGLEEYQSRFVGLTDVDFYDELRRDYRALDKGPFPENFELSTKTECWKRFEKELVAVDGIHALLDQFKGAMAVASSSTIEALYNKLHLTNLVSRFDPHIYSGEHVTNGKPAPDIFLFAARQLGQPPESCTVIEDSVNGVRAGLAAGMEVWGFTGGGHADANLGNRLKRAGAHQVFSGFSGMRPKLAA